MRPWRFRIDVVGRDRRNAAPIVDARFDQPAQRDRGSDWAAPGCSFRARRSGAPPRWSKDALRATGAGTSAIRVPGLGRKFWMMISWICPWASCRSRNASSASIRSHRVSPMPMRMPVVNGTPLLARHADAREPRHRILVGRAIMRPSPLARGARAALSSITPCEIETLRSAARSDASSRPGLTCGNRPVSSNTETRGFRQIRQRRPWPRRCEVVTRRPVAKLRLVAEREQRLLAAGASIPARAMARTASTRQIGATRRRAADAQRCSSGRRRGKAWSAE